jgi:hypothetical protein
VAISTIAHISALGSLCCKTIDCFYHNKKIWHFKTQEVFQALACKFGFDGSF